MIHGPCSYMPPKEVTLIEMRSAIPLDSNEGIYVRDIRDGSIRSISGVTYMLKPHEELWEMDLDPVVESLLG
jgi:major vault protein